MYTDQNVEITGSTFDATSRYDKSKHPAVKTYRFLTYDECKALSGHADAIGNDGRIAHVKITSVKTFKTRPEIQIGWKFGLYEYGKEYICRDADNHFFVTEVESEPEPEPNPECPVCSGIGIPMGALGNLEYFRCESCGCEFNVNRILGL